VARALGKTAVPGDLIANQLSRAQEIITKSR
jgi:hypothetical protein